MDITTTAFLVLAGIVSMFWYAIDRASLLNFAFDGYDVRHGDVWRVITWPVVNPPTDIWVVLTLAFFWFVGHQIEDRIGRAHFTVLFAITVVVSSMLVTLMGFDPVFTFGLGVVGIVLLVVFALDNPGVVFFFGIPAWVLAAVYVGIDVLRYVGDRVYERLMLELVMVVVALVAARQYGMLNNLSFIPRLGSGSKATKPARQRPKGSNSNKVVAGPWQAPAPHHSPADEAELNHLLDKISANGIDALSRDEKTRLNDLSKKLRGR